MKVRLKDIGVEGLRVDCELGRALMGELIQSVDALLERASGSVRAQITRNGSRVFVQAVVHAEFDVPCARCLETAGVRVDGPFSVTYMPKPLVSGEPSALEADDLEILTYRGDEIDLRELVRDQILLAVPMVVLCRPDCRGLCQVCGAELNAGPCGCPTLEPGESLARLGSTRRPS